VISPDRRRQAVEQVQEVLDVSERRVCRVLGQPRSTQRYKKRIADDEESLSARIVALASEYGRYTCTAQARSAVQVWLSAYHRPTASGRLAGEPQACGADLAAGRAKSTRKTAKT